MFDYLKKIFQNTWFKINSLTALSVAIKLVVGIFSAKIISIYIGPGGIAMIGNFRNFFTSVETIATLGFQNGIVANIASNRDNKFLLKRHISSIFLTVSVITVSISILLFSTATFWNDYVFTNFKHFEIIFKITSLLLPFYIGTSIFILILNGLGRYILVIYLTIFGNILGLFVTYFSAAIFGLTGAILTIVVTQSLQFCVFYYFLNKNFIVSENFATCNFDFKIIKNFGSFSIMTAFSAILVPIVFLSIRQNIISKLGFEAAGFWTTIDLLSGYYMLFISTIIVYFYFPKLAVAKSGSETQYIFFKFYKTTIPIFLAGLLVLFFGKTIVINLLFTTEFLPIKKLFFYQLLGDFFKALSLILAYSLIAKKQVTFYLIFEIISIAIMYFSSIYFINIFKIEGVVMAHCLTYIVYFMMLFCFNYKNIFTPKNHL